MLIKCPECELQVSDKALSCPHCGYPMKANVKPRKARSTKRRRLPNGFGQISEIKNRNLRKPYRAMVTIGKSETGRPICKPLKPESYFTTYNEAYAALMEYNKNPYDLSEKTTVEELYKRWSEKRYKTLDKETSRHLQAAWEYCTSVYNLNVQDLRIHHIKFCMTEGTKEYNGKILHTNAATKRRIKTVFNQLLDYAVEYELVTRNVSRDFELPKDVKNDLETKNGHIPFTDEEINILWKNKGTKCIDMLLVQCYSGWRPVEVCTLELSKISFENWSFVGGVKTKAGKDRCVPIHTRIREIVKQYYDESTSKGQKYLFGDRNGYKKYSNDFLAIREQIGLGSGHRLHDGRTHFVTAAKKYNVDEYAIKRIVGHRIDDITERVYTKRSFEWLQSEIEKIK